MITPSMKIATDSRTINLNDFVPGSNEIKFIDAIELISNSNVPKEEIIRWIKSRKRQAKRGFVRIAPDPFNKLGRLGVDILA